MNSIQKIDFLNQSILYPPCLLSTYIYCQVNTQIYGKFIINPQLIYSDFLDLLMNMNKSIFDIPSVVFEIAHPSLNVLFTFEFGLFLDESNFILLEQSVCLYLILDIKKIENIFTFFMLCNKLYNCISVAKSSVSSYGFEIPFLIDSNIAFYFICA